MTTADNSTATGTPAVSPGFFSQLIQVLFQPAQGMAPVPQQGGRYWLALLLTIVLSSAVSWQMFSGMSPEWLVEQQMLQMGNDLSPAEQEQTRAYLAQSAGMMPLLSPVFVAIGTLLMVAILATYLLLTGRVSSNFKFGQWFALVSWSQLPTVVCMLGTAVLLLLSDTPNVSINLMNFASVNQLLLGLTPDSPWFALTEALSLFVLWQVWVLHAGLISAAGYTAQRATLVVGAPVLLIFGGWALAIALG